MKKDEKEEFVKDFVLSHLINAKIHKGVGELQREKVENPDYDLRGLIKVKIDLDEDRIAWILEREGKSPITSDRPREEIIRSFRDGLGD